MSGLENLAQPSLPTIERPLNAILEEPDENKSVAAESESFFSEDDDDEDDNNFPKFTPLASTPTRISFTNSALNNLLNQNQRALQQTAGNMNSIRGLPGYEEETLPKTKSFELNLLDLDAQGDSTLSVPKKMNRVEAYTDLDPSSPLSSDQEKSVTIREEDPFGFLSTEVERPLTATLIPQTSSGFDDLNSSRGRGDVHRTQGPPVRKLILPEPSISPVLVNFAEVELIDTSPDILRLQNELTAARLEISNLLSAIHQKDMNVISANKKIEELQDEAMSEKKDETDLRRRLNTALTNATQLETKNVLLLTQLDELEQENRLTGKNFRDIALLLRIHNIPADDQALAIHLKAKVEGLLKAEVEWSHLKSQKDDLDYSEKNLIEDLANVRAALITEKMLRLQAEALIVRNAESRSSEIRSLQNKLEETENKLHDHEDLSHTIAAEARTLSTQLKNEQMITEKKEKDIFELRSALQNPQENSHGVTSGIQNKAAQGFSEEKTAIDSMMVEERIHKLEAENHFLKEELSSVRRKMIQNGRQLTGEESPQNMSGRQSILRGHTCKMQPPDVIAADKDAKQTGKVKRELKILNGALSKVISTSNGTIKTLQTENLSLVGRLEEHEKNEIRLQSEVRAINQMADMLRSEADLHKRKMSSSPGQTTDSNPPAFQPSLEWTETNLQTLFTQVQNLINLTDVKTNSITQSTNDYHKQITFLADTLRQLQIDVRNQSAALITTQNAPKENTGFVNQLNEYMPATGIQDQQVESLVLRKMLVEREDEIEHWRALYAKRETFDFDKARTGFGTQKPASYWPETLSANQRFWADGISLNRTALDSCDEGQFGLDKHPGPAKNTASDFSVLRRSSSARAYSLRDGPVLDPDGEVYWKPEVISLSEAATSYPGRDVRRSLLEHRENQSAMQMAQRPGSAPPQQSLSDVATSRTESTQTDTVHHAGLPEEKNIHRDGGILGGSTNRRSSLTVSQMSKLSLPAVDYDGIRQRSKKQMASRKTDKQPDKHETDNNTDAQLEELCRRIDRSNAQYTSLLPHRDQNSHFLI